MPQPTTTKTCDDSCIGLECSHLLCHDGESNGTKLIQCEGCGQRFCLAHLAESELSIFLCDACQLADALQSPISTERAWELFAQFGTPFTFTDSWGIGKAAGRKARMTASSGIIYEGSGI